MKMLRLTLVSLAVGILACDPEPQEPDQALRGWGPALEPCGTECLPLLQNCNAGEACLWGGDEWTCRTRSDDQQWAQPCTEATQCDAGLLCVEGARVAECAADYCCTELCDATDLPGACAGGSLCTDVFADGGQDVGVCLIPVVPDMPPMSCIEELEGIAKQN